MLTPEYYSKLSEKTKSIYKDMQDEIIEEIAIRIGNVGYANTVVYNDVAIAQEMGMLYDDVINSVAKYHNSTYDTIKRIFLAAGIKSLAYDDKIYRGQGLDPIPISESPSMLQIMNAMLVKTDFKLDNLCMSTANTTQKDFYNAINKAHLEVITGTKSYNSAINDIVRELKNKGLTVEYPSGYTTSLENAVRMNVVTGVQQTCGKMQEIRADEMGCDLMELSAHADARPEHQQWQGQIVSRSGKEGYLSLDDIGYGTVTGFKGVNCRHDWSPYYEGDARTYSQEYLDSITTEMAEKIEKDDDVLVIEEIPTKEYNTIESFDCLKKYKNLSDEEYKRSYTSNSDYIMEAMAEENGFDKLPTKVSNNEYEKLIKNGNIRVQRVVSDNDKNTADYYVNEFKNGKIYYTNQANMYGNGIYTSGDIKDIETYSKRGKNSKTIEMVIDKNAKIMVLKDQSEVFKNFTTEIKNIPLEYQRVMENPGRILMAKGYDALYVEKMNYYIVYNRGKIFVKE